MLHSRVRLISLFMRNIASHNVNKQTNNNKNLGYECGCPLFSNPQYITLDVYIVISNIYNQ